MLSQSIAMDFFLYINTFTFWKHGLLIGQMFFFCEIDLFYPPPPMFGLHACRSLTMALTEISRADKTQQAIIRNNYNLHPSS